MCIIVIHVTLRPVLEYSKTNKIAKEFFKKAKQDKKIVSITGDGLESLKELKKENNIFDLVFIDADKSNYLKYYDNSVNLVKKNGLIIIDNVLWHGEVVEKKKQQQIY